MIRKFFLFIALTFAVVASAQQAKYVFYFIGDGMGLAQVMGTERYVAQCGGIDGTVRTQMSQFPVVGFATTFSASNPVTDSSAAGTALATGQKTANGVLGMDATKTISLTSIARRAKAKGCAVGVTTSVSIDHATPGAFYASVPSRNDYYVIGTQLAATNFDFFGGADFLEPTGKKNDQKDLHEITAEAGYTTLRGFDAYRKNGKKSEKVILTQTAEGHKKSSSKLPYAIDRDKNDLTLKQITTAAIDFLSSKNEPFFLMVEGGAIDHACHSNDAATAYQEVLDFDEAIKCAYDFYKQHPDETLIVVTADHETGGMALGNADYNLRFFRLGYQKCSKRELSKIMLDELNKKKDKVTFDDVKNLLTKHTGLFGDIKLNEKQEKAIRDAFDKTIKGQSEKVETLYFKHELIASVAVDILNETSRVGWTTGSHSGIPVPIFAIGVGAEQFGSMLDNTDIPARIAKIAGY